MADDAKRPPSKPVRRVRHDTRAEPDSAALPQPESIATLGRRSDSAPASRRNPSANADPRPSMAERALPRRPRTGGALIGDSPGAAEGPGELASLRRQVATLQQELAQTQRRLANMQEERNEEADRISDMLVRNAKADGEERGSAPKLPEPSEPKVDEAVMGQMAQARVALETAERQLTERTRELESAKANLEEERGTTRWLRAAGEQATREVAALRLRVTQPEMKAVESPDAAGLAAEVARLTTEIETANDMRELARGRESALRAELTTAVTKATELAQELSTATASAKANAETEAEAGAKKLEEAIAAARAEATNDAHAKLEEAVVAARSEATTAAEAKLREALAQARAEKTTAADAKLEEALAVAKAEAAKDTEAKVEAAKAEGTISLDRMRAEHTRTRVSEKKEHEEMLTRERKEHAEKAAEVAKAADARVRALGDELTATMASMSAIQAKNDSLSRTLEHDETRTASVNKQLDQATAALATLMRSFEALEQTEERLEALRKSAQDSRATFADQTVALRVALSRAADAAVAPRTTGSLAELEAVKSSPGDKAPRAP